ncbi:uncharacterized protein ARMOST_01611 [Armillaria ostoyae]|uniref:Uncharacterized protein n=1 Tax=Armillaria ostoyae TaxID=47428 RepID=A0A284QPF5_ARMOS|nr:uncharacterized protein ARMOST_01611 [Armillaria ostoyae]
MTTQTDIPSYVTDDYKASLLQYLDADLNSMIIYALLHGIYTGIFAVTMWNIFNNKSRPIRRAIVVVITLLYALITISVVADWSYYNSAFIDSGQNFWTVFLYFSTSRQATSWEMNIAASVSTILADSYIIWCCWTVWGRRWVVVLLPIISLISASGKVSDLIYSFHISIVLYIVSRIMQVYHQYVNGSPEIFNRLYISFILTTTIWCTLLVIYRILSVTGFRRGAEGRLRVYHRFIQVVVESSALYSISLILELALIIRASDGLYYLDTIAAIAKGVAPTLLVGRAAAGHTRPEDDCNEITVSTLHFQTPSERDTTSSQASIMESAVLENDLEAQQQQSDELVVVVERT